MSADTPVPDPPEVSAAVQFAADLIEDRWPGARIRNARPLSGDASSRRYLRAEVEAGGAGAPATLILMLMEDAAVALSSDELSVFGEDGPKELPFLNVGIYLASKTKAVPEIYGLSADGRTLVLEDVGDVTLWDTAQAAASAGDAAEVEEVFGRALDLLADLQSAATSPEGCYAFDQAFDLRLFEWEFDHYLECGVSPDAPASTVDAARSELGQLAGKLAALPRVFCHRDYHAWNLHVQGGEIRVFDFQDALLAPALYDVASLLTDRYAPDLVTPEIEASLLRRFHARQSEGRLDDLAATEAAYRGLALQRTLKVVGRFNYLAEVKGKPHYLDMLPVVTRSARRFAEYHPDLPATRELLRSFVRGLPESSAASGTSGPSGPAETAGSSEQDSHDG